MSASARTRQFRKCLVCGMLSKLGISLMVSERLKMVISTYWHWLNWLVPEEDDNLIGCSTG